MDPAGVMLTGFRPTEFWSEKTTFSRQSQVMVVFSKKASHFYSLLPSFSPQVFCYKFSGSICRDVFRLLVVTKKNESVWGRYFSTLIYCTCTACNYIAQQKGGVAHA